MEPIRKVGIVGAGQMGSGIAHVVALGGYDVAINDLAKERFDTALETIDEEHGPPGARQNHRGRSRTRRSSRISFAETLRGFRRRATWSWRPPPRTRRSSARSSSRSVPFLKPDAILATNTSSISITRLAATTDRPERFIGMHFMNPVPVMELVEMIRGIATDDVTFSRAKDFVETLGKTIAVSEDFPAFMVNRILLPMINEAVYTLYEGVGSVDAIDTAMRLGAHHPMGPLQLADFIGLDTCLSIMQVLYEGLADSKYRPCPLLVKYVEAGWLGRKTKRGFYDYRGETPMPTR